MVAQIDRAYRDAGLSRTLVRLASYSLFEGRPLTTRGRWFNPVVLTLARVLARIGPRDRVDAPIFIIGTGRSGTTILGKLLSLHRDVGYLNEPKAIWHCVRPDEDLIGSYSATAGRYCLDESDADADTVNRFRRIYGAYLALVRRTRVVDKYPEAVFRVPFLCSVFPDAKFLWLVRDGYDTTASIARWSSTHARRTSDQADTWWGRNDRKWRALVSEVCGRHESYRNNLDELQAITSDVDRGAVEWAVSALQGMEVERELPQQVLRVRFEDLTAKTDDAMRDVLGFCGLPEDEPVFVYARSSVEPRPRVDAPVLSPVVRPAFEQAMRRLGYERRGE